MVGDGPGIMADADAAVEGHGAEPDRPLFLAVVQHLPEPHMMAVIGALAVRLFEREILAAVEIEQRADRRVAVGPVQQHAADDLDRGSQRHGIGGKPAGGRHRAQHVLVVADQADIDRIAGNALRGARHHRQIGEALLVLVMRPQRRQREIGEHGIGEHDRERGQQEALQPRAIGQGLRFDIVVKVSHGDTLIRIMSLRNSSAFPSCGGFILRDGMRPRLSPGLAAAGGFGVFDRAEPARALADLHLDLGVPAAVRACGRCIRRTC